MRNSGESTEQNQPVPRTTPSGLWLKVGASLILAIAIAAAISPYLQTIPKDLSIAPGVVAAYLGTLLPYHLLRAGRWHVLLRPLVPDKEPLNPSVVTRLSLAGYMWIALLPFRLGEFARPLFAAQKTSVTATRALGTVAIERVVDGLIVCGLFFTGVAGARTSTDLDALLLATTAVMSLFAGLLVAMIVAAIRPRWVGLTTKALIGWASQALAARVAQILVDLAEGLRALPSPRAIVRFVVLSAAYWTANALGMWLLLDGCGLALDFQQAVALLAVMNIALLVPGGPAQFGVFQTGVALGLSLFVPPDDVLGAGSRFAFYLYVCQLGTIVVLGVGSQWSLGLDWRRLFRSKNSATDLVRD